jgi:hypothetical protein
MVVTLLLVPLAWLLGTFPSALLVARAWGVDITKEGSGNPGASNVARVLGWRFGLIVMLMDFSKGAIAAGAGLAVVCGLLTLAAEWASSCRRERAVRRVQWARTRRVAWRGRSERVDRYSGRRAHRPAGQAITPPQRKGPVVLVTGRLHEPRPSATACSLSSGQEGEDLGDGGGAVEPCGRHSIGLESRTEM